MKFLVRRGIEHDRSAIERSYSSSSKQGHGLPRWLSLRGAQRRGNRMTALLRLNDDQRSCRSIVEQAGHKLLYFARTDCWRPKFSSKQVRPAYAAKPTTGCWAVSPQPDLPPPDNAQSPTVHQSSARQRYAHAAPWLDALQASWR